MNDYDTSSHHADDPYSYYDPSLTGGVAGSPSGGDGIGGAVAPADGDDDGPMLISQQGGGEQQPEAGHADDVNAVDFDDPNISSLPRVLLMGPRRGGKTSIQVRTRSAVVAVAAVIDE